MEYGVCLCAFFFHLLAFIWLTERNEERCLSALNSVTCCDVTSLVVICRVWAVCVFVLFFVCFCVCVCWCCLFFLIYFLSFNPALPSLSLFTCDSSLSYPGVRGCGWGQRQVGSIASCSCNLYSPPPCWAVSKNFGGACRVPETPLCSVIRGWGVGSHAILLAGLHTPGRKQPVACCIL